MVRLRLLRELTLERSGGPASPSHVSAASGLAIIDQHLYVIADDEAAIGRWPASGDAPGRLHQVLPESLPRDPAERKEAKADLEALARVPGGLLAFGSGSSPRRRRAVAWPVERGERPRAADLTGLYAAIERELGIINIEGATVRGQELLLAHRGVGHGETSAIVTLALRPLLTAVLRGDPAPVAALESVERQHPGELDGVTLGITDIDALPDGRIVFSAAAEDSSDPVHDGAIAGSVVGVLGGAAPERVDGGHKVEGVLARVRGGAIHVLLVADPDDRAVPAPLLEGELSAR